MRSISLQGFGRGVVEQKYPSSTPGVLALNSFYFRFERSGGRIDNQLLQIMVLPGGPSTDVTLSPGLPPSNLAAGRVLLAYEDDDVDHEDDLDDVTDRYFYNIAHLVLPTGSARRFQFRDVGDRGSVRRPLPPQILAQPGHSRGQQSLVALAGFQMAFAGKDHDVDQVAVMLEDDGTYTVALNDKNNDDVFAYQIDVVRISGENMNFVLGGATGSAKGGKSVQVGRPASADLVLRGFDFDFASRDRQLRDIGVTRRADKLDIFFGDKTPDDPFRWRLKWAHVGERVLAPPD